MMGIMVPETCSANSKFHNKETNLLHLVGLLISTYVKVTLGTLIDTFHSNYNPHYII